MKYRKLRIAWSVAWGALAVLVCVLWIRSYSWMDRVVGPMPGLRGLVIDSLRGDIPVYIVYRNSGETFSGWSYDCVPVDNSVPDARWAELLPKGLGRFSFVHNAAGCIVRSPHNFFVLLSAILATLPWIGWSKRFSLRTLLIATTLIAVVLGIIVWAVRAG